MLFNLESLIESAYLKNNNNIRITQTSVISTECKYTYENSSFSQKIIQLLIFDNSLICLEVMLQLQCPQAHLTISPEIVPPLLFFMS